MDQIMTDAQLKETIEHFIDSRCEGVDPTAWNLRFCPAVESCNGAARRALLRLHTYPWMANPMQITHGGIVTSLLDSSMGILCCALYGAMTPTITMTTNYYRPVPLDTDILVSVRAAYCGRSSAQLTAELFLPDDPTVPLVSASGVYHTAHIRAK